MTEQAQMKSNNKKGKTRVVCQSSLESEITKDSVQPFKTLSGNKEKTTFRSTKEKNSCAVLPRHGKKDCKNN